MTQMNNHHITDLTRGSITKNLIKLALLRPAPAGVNVLFQGIGKTYPTFLAAVLDNGLYALMVFTLPGIFGWGIEAIWWIKLITAGLEMVFCGIWLKWHLKRIRGIHPFQQP
jgi:Na+-driven multidrug efflux pump